MNIVEILEIQACATSGLWIKQALTAQHFAHRPILGSVMDSSSSSSTRDLLVDAICLVTEVKAEVATAHTQLKKLEEVLQQLKSNIMPPPVFEHPLKRPADDNEERDHKRLKALFQQRGMNTPTLDFGPAWEAACKEEPASQEAPTLPAVNYEQTLRT